MFKKQGNGNKLLGPIHLEVRCLDLAENAYKRISMALNILKHFLHPATCKRTQANLFAGKDPLLPATPPPSSTPSRTAMRGFGPRAHGNRGRGANGPNPLALITAMLQATAPGSQYYPGNNENGGNSSSWNSEQDSSNEVRRGGRSGRSHPYTRGRGFVGRGYFNPPPSKPF